MAGAFSMREWFDGAVSISAGRFCGPPVSPSAFGYGSVIVKPYSNISLNLAFVLPNPF
jgi:hypothetical protein